jgi:cyclase
MTIVRIIPCLDVKDGKLVKGVNFESLKDVGDVVTVAKAYSKSGADELVFLDITATVEKRKTMVDTVRKVSAVIDVPFTVGGGIRDLADIEAVLDAGATRISINSAAVQNPQIIDEAVKKYGSDRIVIAIDVVSSPETKSGYEVVTHAGSYRTGKDVLEWASEVESRGVGSILPTSKDKDGTQEGYDIILLKSLTNTVNIPVIASGGAGTLEHLYEAVVCGGADAVLVASMFHFGQHTIREVKEYLKNRGVKVNL